MNSGPICAMVWQGRDAVKTGRSMLTRRLWYLLKGVLRTDSRQLQPSSAPPTPSPRPLAPSAGKFWVHILCTHVDNTPLISCPWLTAPSLHNSDYAIDVGRNVCHGSDSVENAKKEIALWFKAGEVVNWSSENAKWIYEKP